MNMNSSKGDPSRGELLSSEQYGEGGDTPIDLDEDDDLDTELISKDDQSLEQLIKDPRSKKQ